MPMSGDACEGIDPQELPEAGTGFVIEFFAPDDEHIDHAGWLQSLTIDDDFNTQPLLSVDSAVFEEWETRWLTESRSIHWVRVDATLTAALSEMYNPANWYDDPNTAFALPVFRVTLEDRSFWGWVGDSVAASPQTPTLTLVDETPRTVLLDSSRLSEGAIDPWCAARQAWMTYRIGANAPQVGAVPDVVEIGPLLAPAPLPVG